ncbi:MAG: type II toxin-antitoxin system RelE/ParE family toxin [Nitriliruptor sp.]|uniref:type II toxin-antitoxin system RelE/ParE family toxin n=1 Tax=Nitriliruptor sp. TaxID=2448056 RepID=UPI00349FD615
MAHVLLTRTARDALAALDFLLADAVLDALGELGELGELEREPEIGHQLRGRLTGLRSYRVGVYRTIYELRDDRTVRVVAIRHRGDAYGSDPR